MRFRNFLFLFLSSVFIGSAGIASAEPSFIYESSPATRTDKFSTQALTDNKGRTQCLIPSLANNIAKDEDAAHASGDTGVQVLGVVVTGSYSPTTSTAGDYASPSLDATTGGVLVELRGAGNQAASPIRGEDSTFGDAQFMMVSGFQTQDPLAQDQSASNKLGPPKIDRVGRVITTMAPSGETWQACSASNTGTTDIAIKAAVASNRIYVTSISCYNTAAVDSAMTFKDGTTAIYAGAIAKQATNGGGFAVSLPVPLKGTVNTAFNFAMTTTATATTCCAAGYISVY